MTSPSAVVCREVFDENSQPSAEEISDYAQQLGIDPESESHLLPLAKDGLMQPLPAPWKAYFDEKLQTHYYYNEDLNKTQWEHPLDHVYRELVKKARDISMQDDTCASVQELLTSEENTKHLERVETKAESDEEFSTDSENHVSDVKDNLSTTLVGPRRLTPLGRPPISPMTRFDKKLSDLRISPLRRSAESPSSPKPVLIRNTSDRDLLSRPSFERPKMLFKQHSEIIDLKMHVLTSPEEEDHFSPLLTAARVEKGLPLKGKGNLFFKLSKSDLPSPDTEKSYPLDSMTKSDPPKGILREKVSDPFQKKAEAILFGRPKTASFDDDRKSVRFKLENLPDPTTSPGSNSSSEQNDNQSSIISAPVPSPPVASPHATSQPRVIMSSPNASPMTSTPLAGIVLSPLASRPPLPPRHDSPRDSIVDTDSHASNHSRASPRRRVLRPPAADYIKPDLFQKNFQKISDLVRPGELEPSGTHLEEPGVDKEARPRSPMIPQKSKISINLMESIESETSIDSPDREFANLDLLDLDDSIDTHKENQPSEAEPKYIDNRDLTKDVEDISKASDSKSHREESSKGTERNESKSQKDISKANDSKSHREESSRATERNESKSQRDISKASDSKSHREESSKTTERNESKSQKESFQIPHIKVPTLDLPKHLNSDTENSKSLEESKLSKSSIDIPKSPSVKISPTPSIGSDMRSPRLDYGKPWSPLSTFRPLNKAVISSQIKTSESSSNISKSLTSPRLDGVIISQGKSSSDNVVVVYQFESQEEHPKPIRSPLIPDMARDMMERNKADERRRLELSLQKELENIRMEWSSKERKMRAELQEELRDVEVKFLADKKARLNEQAERQKRELEEALSEAELNHQQSLQTALAELDDKFQRDTEAAEGQHAENMTRLKNEYKARLMEQQRQLEIENERALSDLHEQLQANVSRERARLTEENRTTVASLREEHAARVAELRHDYRAEVEHLRMQHLCHLEEVRARLATDRAAARSEPRALHDKYRCLKEKHARLKHDVKLSIERRNKRREMSMTTGSETEKSNSHKANQSLERCKEANETSVSVVIEAEPRVRVNPTSKCNDNETSYSGSNAHKSIDNNNVEWKLRRLDIPLATSDVSQTSVLKQRAHRRGNVAFREPLTRRKRDTDKDAGATTDCQDSSDATTADEKPKESMNGHGRRRCFTRLKSASTSRLNYSPKRGEGWSSPLESLRQQLRKLDDLEDQFPDLACQQAYSLRYPFTEIGAVSSADTPELEFVRHRALIEREGMRRARAVLKRRRAALKESRAELSPHRAPSEEREATELEVALHRARALLGEKEIRLRHIERALRLLAPRRASSQPAAEPTASEASSGSEAVNEAETGGAVLRSLRALHADVRDIWRTLDARRGQPASPETSSCNAASTSQTRLTLSAPDPMIQDNSDGGVSERARGLRAWLQTAP